ncbi:MAG: glycosyltransferase family 2 protein [Desulfobaccales bacterium]
MSAVKPIDLSIVAPMYNEESNIDYFFDTLIPVLTRLNLEYEIICINDGSKDCTLEKLLNYHQNNPQIKIINFSRNFGKEVAMTAGLHHSSGQAIIPIDTDLQDPPELITELVEKWREGYDVVYAVRRQRLGESSFKRFTANAFYRFINAISDTPIPRDTGDFRLFDRKVVKELNRIPERTRFMKGLFAWVGFKQVGIEYDRQPRYRGKTKWNYWKLWNFALDGITLFSTIPLKLWSYIGIIISLLSFGYGSFLILRTIILGKDVPGYASIMVAVLFLGGLQLISLGIIGEYLGRIYAETKRRPLYIINELYGLERKAEA